MPNAVAGLEAFIEAWDAARAASGVPEAPSGRNVGPGGQINVEGSATCLTADVFVPSDPRFVAAIEPGVRELCLALIERLDCVTYSSCEGHRAGDGGRFRPRHVGIVPRNDAEAERLEDALEALCIQTNRSSADFVVRSLLVIGRVEGDHGERACLDLLFFGEGVDEARYFEETHELTRTLLKNLMSPRAVFG